MNRTSDYLRAPLCASFTFVLFAVLTLLNAQSVVADEPAPAMIDPTVTVEQPGVCACNKSFTRDLGTVDVQTGYQWSYWGKETTDKQALILCRNAVDKSISFIQGVSQYSVAVSFVPSTSTKPNPVYSYSDFQWHHVYTCVNGISLTTSVENKGGDCEEEEDKLNINQTTNLWACTPQ